MHKGAKFAVALLTALAAVAPAAQAAPRKAHSVVLGAVRNEPYSSAGDPAGAAPGETELKVRALLVGGVLKEWTTGEMHDVTDRSFVVRRAIRLNNSLPADKQVQWVWQRGPWLLVDRETGRITALKLPDYDPAVSRVDWFRDYGAYCGVTPSGKSLYAVVAQIAARKAVLAKKLSAFDPSNRPQLVCGPAVWQRQPLRVTFQPTGKAAVSYEIVPGSAVLVEDADEDSSGEAAGKPKKQVVPVVPAASAAPAGKPQSR